VDPTTPTFAAWADIGDLITGMAVMVGLVVFFSTNMLIGHIFIPSLVASSHIPEKLQKVRPVFYALAVISFAATIFVLTIVIDRAGVIRDIYETFWIDGGRD
tara:strand:- start:503 stop:808 length:306 start_codon:yes stop_codon:yes gene_type:complete